MAGSQRQFAPGCVSTGFEVVLTIFTWFSLTMASLFMYPKSHVLFLASFSLSTPLKKTLTNPETVID